MEIRVHMLIYISRIDIEMLEGKSEASRQIVGGIVNPVVGNCAGGVYIFPTVFESRFHRGVGVGISHTQGEAREVIAALIRGFDENPKIRRLIPKIRGCMSVRVEGNTAHVNITNAMVKNHPEGRILEQLTVYSFVNSLTSIRGVDNVQFTVDGKIRRDFMGYMDMRGAFAFKDVV